MTFIDDMLLIDEGEQLRARAAAGGAAVDEIRRRGARRRMVRRATFGGLVALTVLAVVPVLVRSSTSTLETTDRSPQETVTSDRATTTWPPTATTSTPLPTPFMEVVRVGIDGGRSIHSIAKGPVGSIASIGYGRGVSVDPVTGTVVVAGTTTTDGREVELLPSSAINEVVPVLRAIRADGSDRVLVVGADSPAVSGTGVLAYAAYVDRAVSTEGLRDGWVGPLSTVVIRPTLESEPQTWLSEPGRYQPLAWAGKTLLVLRETTKETAGPVSDRSHDVVYVRDGVVVGEITGLPLAISPDGRSVLMSEPGEEPRDESEAPRPTLHLRSVADLADLDSITWSELLQATDGSLDGIHATFHDWAGQSLVLQGTTGLLVLQADGASLSVSGTITAPEGTFITGWTVVDGTHVRTSTAPLGGASAETVLDCSLTELTCSPSNDQSNARGSRWPTVDPSRG